jgi:hypothetical protein
MPTQLSQPTPTSQPAPTGGRRRLRAQADRGQPWRSLPVNSFTTSPTRFIHAWCVAPTTPTPTCLMAMPSPTRPLPPGRLSSFDATRPPGPSPKSGNSRQIRTALRAGRPTGRWRSMRPRVCLVQMGDGWCRYTFGQTVRIMCCTRSTQGQGGLSAVDPHCPSLKSARITRTSRSLTTPSPSRRTTFGSSRWSTGARNL